MNKTLLLILCDFLLLTLIALTRWENAEPPQPAAPPPVPEMAANAVTKEQDLLETMRQSLADEKATRDDLAQKLTATDATLAAREQSLAQLQSERTKLASTLTETQRAAADLNQKYTTATQEATMTKEQLAQLQRELAERQAEADRQKEALAQRQKELGEATKKINGLYTMVALAEQEKKTLRETAEALKGQVEAERTERAKVQETATQLAQGVGQLAEKSGELTKEIRDNRPINANTLFNDFLTNRVVATFKATRKVFLGNPTRTREANTVLVTDGKQVYALLHVADTPFSFDVTNPDYESLSVTLSRNNGGQGTANRIEFLAHDPRIVVIPLDAAETAALGARIYPLAVNPFKFPEAVLIDGSGKGYGEVGFKLDQSEPNFVRVDNRFFKRVFGDFAPKRGDLVFSKTGELLGIMVNNDYCAVVKDFTPAKTIQAGPDIKAQATSALFTDLYARVQSMPLKLQ